MRSTATGRVLSVGEDAIDFALPDLAGKATNLADLVKQSPALLAFYKASCPICQFTFPFLERLHAGQRDRALPFFAISQDDAATARSFLAKFGVTFPALVDSPPYPVSDAYGITHVPSMFIVERDGAIGAAWSGFSKDDLAALGRRIGVEAFRPDEKVPEFRPG